jgi:hypothetical protein
MLPRMVSNARVHSPRRTHVLGTCDDNTFSCERLTMEAGGIIDSRERTAAVLFVSGSKYNRAPLSTTSTLWVGCNLTLWRHTDALGLAVIQTPPYSWDFSHRTNLM